MSMVDMHDMHTARRLVEDLIGDTPLRVCRLRSLTKAL